MVHQLVGWRGQQAFGGDGAAAGAQVDVLHALLAQQLQGGRGGQLAVQLVQPHRGPFGARVAQLFDGVDHGGDDRRASGQRRQPVAAIQPDHQGFADRELVGVGHEARRGGGVVLDPGGGLQVLGGDEADAGQVEGLPALHAAEYAGCSSQAEQQQGGGAGGFARQPGDQALEQQPQAEQDGGVGGDHQGDRVHEDAQEGGLREQGEQRQPGAEHHGQPVFAQQAEQNA